MQNNDYVSTKKITLVIEFSSQYNCYTYVLYTFQALIFVKDPYFNEPGFERYIGTDKGAQLSNAYNQQLQHATLHYAILEQLRHPPEYFRVIKYRNELSCVRNKMNYIISQ